MKLPDFGRCWCGHIREDHEWWDEEEGTVSCVSCDCAVYGNDANGFTMEGAFEVDGTVGVVLK